MIGVPDEALGEEVAAAVVLRPGHDASADDIREFVKERLAAYKYPRHVSFADEPPRGRSARSSSAGSPRPTSLPARWLGVSGRRRTGRRSGSRGLGEPAVEPLAQLVRLVMTLRAALAGEHHAGGGHSGEAGETDELPAHSHRSRRLLAA